MFKFVISLYKIQHMKKLLFFLIIVAACSFSSKAQDTLYTKNGKSIICIVTEIGIDEIKYKDYENPEGPVYVVRKVDVLRIIYKNGKTEYIVPDEMAMNKEEEIVDKNQCIKVAFLSPLFNHIELAYERKLKMTKNLEVNFGYIGLGTGLSNYEPQGGYVAAGVKFLLGQDYYVNGMRYMHPLKGSYLKPELTFSMLEYTYTINYASWPPAPATVSRYRASLAAINIVYGKQYILGNLLTFDFHFGVGLGIASSWQVSGTPYDYINFGSYGSCVHISEEFPMTLTGGLLIGYIFK